MEIIDHTINNIKIAEVKSTEIIIKNTEDGLDLLGNLYYQDFDKSSFMNKISLQSFLI